MTARMGVRTSDMLRERLNALKACGKTSWRKIAAQDEFQPVPAGTLCAIARGAEVPKRWREHLGLAAVGTVYIVGEGSIPPGAQVISANIGVCACGTPFFSNHPARKKCFICSPFRKRTK